MSFYKHRRRARPENKITGVNWYRVLGFSLMVASSAVTFTIIANIVMYFYNSL